ncbi:MAG TPA: hypothetical protein VE959_16485 [Bryobacteraceae bacterium]|nr:hypothetical protein [Bryobacteraceae bacterium]
MTTAQKLDKLTELATTHDNQLTELTRQHQTTLASIQALERTANALQATTAAHDAQIEQLIAISEQNARQWQNLQRRLPSQ